MTARVIIFDFDGTIADSFVVFFEITNRLSGDFGYKQVDDSELLRLRNLSSRQIIKESQISVFKLPFLLKKIRGEFSKEIGNLQPISGIELALVALKEEGYQLGIITSNIRNNVITFLENNNLTELFDFIYSGTMLFRKHKIINKFLRQSDVKAEGVIYVGDETRDIVAAKKSNIKVIAVGWGFNSPSVLARHQPDFLIQQPQELITVVKSL